MAIGEAGTNTVAPEHPFVKLMYVRLRGENSPATADGHMPTSDHAVR